MRSIISRAEGKSWPRYVRELAQKEGIARASAEEARRFDARRDKLECELTCLAVSQSLTRTAPRGRGGAAG